MELPDSREEVELSLFRMTVRGAGLLWGCWWGCAAPLLPAAAGGE